MRKRKIKKAPVRNDTSAKKKKATINKAKKAKESKSRVPKTRNANTMTEAAFWQMIRAALRNRTRFWKPRLKCLEKARRPNESLNRRLKWEFLCNSCLNYFPQTQVEAHHEIQAGTLKCAQDLPLFVENLFCEDGWICLCKNCHKKEHEKL